MKLSTTGLPTGVTQGDVMGTVGSSNAAAVTIAGTWDPIGDITAVTNWTGGAVEMIPPTPMAPALVYDIANCNSTSCLRTKDRILALDYASCTMVDVSRHDYYY